MRIGLRERRKVTEVRGLQLASRVLSVFARHDQTIKTPPVQVEPVVNGLVLPIQTASCDSREEEKPVVEVAEVALVVAVGILLVGVLRRQAVVADVSDPIRVGVVLKRVVGRWAVVARITPAVSVEISLARILHSDAIVTSVANVVMV